MLRVLVSELESALLANNANFVLLPRYRGDLHARSLARNPTDFILYPVCLNTWKILRRLPKPILYFIQNVYLIHRWVPRFVNSSTPQFKLPVRLVLEHLRVNSLWSS